MTNRLFTIGYTIITVIITTTLWLASILCDIVTNLPPRTYNVLKTSAYYVCVLCVYVVMVQAFDTIDALSKKVSKHNFSRVNIVVCRILFLDVAHNVVQHALADARGGAAQCSRTRVGRCRERADISTHSLPVPGAADARGGGAVRQELGAWLSA